MSCFSFKWGWYQHRRRFLHEGARWNNDTRKFIVFLLSYIFYSYLITINSINAFLKQRFFHPSREIWCPSLPIVQQVIGQGAQGVVYKALDSVSGESWVFPQTLANVFMNIFCFNHWLPESSSRLSRLLLLFQIGSWKKTLGAPGA